LLIVALTLSNKTTFIWNWLNQTILYTFSNWPGLTTNMKLLNDGRLALVLNSWTLGIVNTTRGSTDATLNNGDNVWCFEMLANGLWLMCKSTSGLNIWNITSQVLVKTIATMDWQFSAKQTCLSNYVATGSATVPGNIYIWNLDSYSLVRVLRGHKNQVAVLETTPSGYLLSGSWDWTVKLWNFKTGELQSSIVILCNPNSISLIKNNLLAVSGSACSWVYIIQINALNQLSYVKQISHAGSKVANSAVSQEGVLFIGFTAGGLGYYNLTSSQYMFSVKNSTFIGNTFLKNTGSYR
jgi:WD40 repeat protein